MTCDNVPPAGLGLQAGEGGSEGADHTMRDEAPSGLGPVPVLRWGTHICQAFERDGDLEEALVPYFAAGLRNHEACLWVTAAPFTADRARAALRAAVPDLDDRERTSQIEIRDASDWYKDGQPIVPDDLVADLVSREKDALARGYQGLRTNGNCAWVGAGQRADFQRYEALVQSTVRGRRMICMCSYGPHQTREPGFHDVVLAHHVLLSPGIGAGRVAPDAEARPAPRGDDAPLRCDDVLITGQLARRAAVNGPRHKPALDQLVRRVTDQPAAMLPKLVQVALDICGGGSAGVSVLEGAEFRWLGLHGALSVFEGARTPRDDSPCGVCLDQDGPILMEEPERIYSWIADANISVPEVLLAPLRAPDGEQIGTLWVVSDRKGHFDAGHAQTLAELATFTGMALHMIGTEERLTRALEQERLVAGEMSHRVKNMWAVATSIVKMSAQKAASPREMSDSVIARLTALSRAHGLAEGAQAGGVGLQDLLGSVLEPYSNCEISGPPAALVERALAPLAMTFHELATNAVKYGALSVPNGRVDISWRLDQAHLAITWRERNGPPPETPAPHGFGSALIRSSIGSLNGTVVKSWSEAGLEAQITLPRDLLPEPAPTGPDTDRPQSRIA